MINEKMSGDKEHKGRQRSKLIMSKGQSPKGEDRELTKLVKTGLDETRLDEAC